MDRSLAAVRAGRVTRGVLATLVLCGNSFLALLMLTFSCCSSPPMSKRIGNPLFWACGCAMVTAVCAFPPISKRLRRTPARWVCAPFVAGTFFFPLLAARDLRDIFSLPNAWGVVAPTGICALYVLFRVLLFPDGPGEAGGEVEGPGGGGRTP